MKAIAMLVTLLGFVSTSVAGEPAADNLDFGDHKSVTLMVKAWEALGAREYVAAVRFTEKCTELYEDQARKMQASLKAKPSSEHANDYWALNDVGTCYFIRGEALMKLDRDKEALAAYKVVMDELYYSQAWDPKGWFWSPADAVAPKIELIKLRNKNDF